LEALARCRGRCLWRAPATKVYKVEYAPYAGLMGDLWRVVSQMRAIYGWS
jgi:hypothetical protein